MKIEEDKSDKINIFLIVVIFFYSLILLRLCYLQIIRGDYYKNMSENNRIKMKSIEGSRGKIYDKKGRLIVTNIPGYRLVYLKGRKYDEKILKNISMLIGEEEKTVEKRIKNGEIFKYTMENVLDEDLDEVLAHKILEKIDNYPYLDVVYYPKRKYVYGSLGSSFLGYVKAITKDEYEKQKDKGYSPKDIIGKVGLEKYYDQFLRGKDGFEYIEVDATNKLVKTINKKESIPGRDMYLTIDLELQIYMTDYMKGKKGAVVAMDPKTGGVITMVSNPEYDLNKFTSKISVKDWNEIRNNPDKPLQNRVSVGTYPPGSIFKPITALAILEKGIDPRESIYDPGYFRMGSWTWKDWKLDGHGTVNFENAMKDSCDTYYYTMSDRIGNEKIVEVSKRFGLGELTGIDLLEEKKGVLPDNAWKKKTTREQWYRGDTINLSIGQGYLLVTPLQMTQMYCILANKGYAYRPHLLDKFIAADGKIESSVLEIKNKVETKPGFFKLINNGLRKVVTNGTATILNMKNIEVAGKTGSAENAHYKLTHGWFAGFAPLENPEIVIVAFGEGIGHGGSEAAPIVKAFLEKYYEIKNRDLKVDRSYGERKSEEKFILTHAAFSINNPVSRIIKYSGVENEFQYLKDLPIYEKIQILKDESLFGKRGNDRDSFASNRSNKAKVSSLWRTTKSGITTLSSIIQTITTSRVITPIITTTKSIITTRPAIQTTSNIVTQNAVKTTTPKSISTSKPAIQMISNTVTKNAVKITTTKSIITTRPAIQTTSNIATQNAVKITTPKSITTSKQAIQTTSNIVTQNAVKITTTKSVTTSKQAIQTTSNIVTQNAVKTTTPKSVISKVITNQSIVPKKTNIVTTQSILNLENAKKENLGNSKLKNISAQAISNTGEQNQEISLTAHALYFKRKAAQQTSASSIITEGGIKNNNKITRTSIKSLE